MTVGKKLVYFPNIVFTMIRTQLPPNQVAFKVPIHLSKLDIQDYLTNIYKVKPVDVRTMLYQGKIKREPGTNSRYRDASYKKAIVTLDHEFVYPEPPKMEDFNAALEESQKNLMKRKVRGWRIRPDKNEVKPSIPEVKQD
jgi:ribosomal protein L23